VCGFPKEVVVPVKEQWFEPNEYVIEASKNSPRRGMISDANTTTKA
jgi:hypothetical protein